MLVLTLAALLAAGCSKSSKKSGTGEMDGSDLGTSASLSDEDLALKNQERFGSGNIPLAEGEGLFRDVHFEYNSSQLTSEGIQIVKENAQKLQTDPELRIQVEGHCDKRGTSDFNMALGEERAKAVARSLTAHGVAPKQISIVSYGEEVPLDPSENEEAFSKNRRAHLSAQGRTGSAQFGGGLESESGAVAEDEDSRSY